MSFDEALQEPLIERLSASPEFSSADDRQSKKRKHSSKSDNSAKTQKKRKVVDNDELDLEAGINTSFANMDSQLLADYVAQKTRKFESELSSVELEDRYISGGFQSKA